MITNAAQELNQQRKSILRLCFERMFVTTHVGRRSKKVGSAGRGSTGEGFGEAEASEEGGLGLASEDMEEGVRLSHSSIWGELRRVVFG
jgi:hypothetical protein